jgi:peptidyl-prolyl cis-trans isomerase SurA
MRTVNLKLLLILALAIVLGASREVRAQNIVVLVNDEPITSFDVAQRARWMARTNGFGDRMKSALTGQGIQDRFRQMMIAAQPHSQAEAQAAAERIKKQLIEDTKRRVLSDSGGSTRKAAIDALIEDKLKLQAAKKLDIKITDKEVEDTLAQRAGGEGAEKKEKLEEFYKQFEADGINRQTIKEIIRAQLAWRDCIRRVYGPRIASMMAAIPDSGPKASELDVHYDVRVLRLAVKDAADQKAISARMLEAENLKEKFTSCANLPKEAQLVPDASVKLIEKARLSSFPKDVQPLIDKAGEGQMTPPVLVGSAVESYAVCKKVATSKPEAHPEVKPDARQAEYERFSRSYLQELKQKAAIDYRGT